MAKELGRALLPQRPNFPRNERSDVPRSRAVDIALLVRAKIGIAAAMP
jgi:hypothetical protein